MSFDQNDSPANVPHQPPTPGATPAPFGAQPPASGFSPHGPQGGMPVAPDYQPSGPAGRPASKAPGKTMGIIGFILSLLLCIPFAPLVGIGLSVAGLIQSRKAGARNGLALAGIIVGIISIIVQVGAWVFFFAALLNGCNELGPGVHDINGFTLTCS